MSKTILIKFQFLLSVSLLTAIIPCHNNSKIKEKVTIENQSVVSESKKLTSQKIESTTTAVKSEETDSTTTTIEFNGRTVSINGITLFDKSEKINQTVVRYAKLANVQFETKN